MNNNTKKVFFWISFAICMGCVAWFVISYPWNEINTPAENLRQSWKPLAGIFVSNLLLSLFDYKIKKR